MRSAAYERNGKKRIYGLTRDAGIPTRSLMSKREPGSGTSAGVGRYSLGAALRGGRNGSVVAIRPYESRLPRPAISGEKRGLERHEERRVVEEKERGGAAVSRGSITQILTSERSGVWNDMGSPALWTHWKRRSCGLNRVV